MLPLSAQVAQLHETDPQALSGAWTEAATGAAPTKCAFLFTGAPPCDRAGSAQGARLMGEYCTRFRAELLKQR